MGNRIIDTVKSEPSKWMPIGISSLGLLISFIALLISLLGWREARQGRLMNEAVNRPILAVETTSVPSESPRPKEMIFVITDITNSGKMAATIDKVQHDLIFWGECKPVEQDSEGRRLKELVGKEVVPSLSLFANQPFELTPECSREKEISFISQGRIHYTDKINGIPYTQDFIELVTLPNPTFANPRNNSK